MDQPPEHCEVEIRVRYAECDAMGYLHHAKYFEHFEIARTELLRQSGYRYRDLEKEGIFFVVAKLECRFKHPIRYDDVVVVRVEVTRTTRARIEHRYEVLLDGLVCCEAASTLACVGRDSRPILIPERLWPPQFRDHPPAADATAKPIGRTDA
ncbi:MAG: acyl-CoA thioesterase [Phycisphaerae bacterium]|nr:acyl-CoA thioesterase [Phycisphaerae bacterium]